MILVTGATGNVGSALVKELVAGGQKVRAFVTDPAAAKATLGDKVELARGNFEDRASLDAAMKGIEKVYLLAPAGPQTGAWETAAIDAAKKAGVKHVVKHSVSGAQYDALLLGKWHRVGEKALEASGMAWTFLRPVGFFQNAMMWIGSVKSQGAIYQPMGNGKMASIDARDIASVAAKVLTSDIKTHDKQAYDLTGPELLDMNQQAKLLGEAIGKPVKYVDVPDSAAKDAMLGMGMPAINVDALLEFTNLVRSGQAELKTDVVSKLTGKPARTFAAWCKENAAAFK